MKVELITQDAALKKSEELKELAFSIAKTNDTLPGYCNAPECILYIAYAQLASELKLGEVCIFIDDQPAMQITDFEIAPGRQSVSKFCTAKLWSAEIANDVLILSYPDGVKEEYSFVQDLQAWKFNGKNISIKVPTTSAN